MIDEKKKENGDEEESVAGDILKGIGKTIPGLGGLLKSLEKSPAFKERLKKVDQEVERKIKETPLKKTEARPSSIPGGIHPGVRGGDVRRKSFVKQPSEGITSPPPTPQEKPVDIFDEPDHIKVIAEIPGCKEEDIKIGLEKDKLTISCDVPEHKYEKELILPCVPEGQLTKTYKNGILEVVIKKE